MQGVIRKFAADESGAVAGLYAVALIGLIAIGGVGFDYARMAGMDSELQNAADQAALAAATQLDGEDGACDRAEDAAINLLSNITLLSNDGLGNQVTVSPGGAGATGGECGDRGRIRFYETYVSALQQDSNVEAASDEDAHFVLVEVDPRTARYAFTPIVGAIFPTMSARAVASTGSAICNTPPLMICDPEPLSEQPIAERFGSGIGIQVTAKNPGTEQWSPGNFGFLRIGDGDPHNVIKALAFDPIPFDCTKIEGTVPDTGANQNKYRAINTRFDIYETDGTPLGECNDGRCPAASLVAKDLIRSGGTSGNNACKLHKNGWRLPPENEQFLPNPIANSTYESFPVWNTNTVAAMGFPRDLCHYDSWNAGHPAKCENDTDNRFGNGDWARGDYFKWNHPGKTLPLNKDKITRYDTYLWELAGNKPDESNGQEVDPVCSMQQRLDNPNAPHESAARRVLTVAIVNNCSELKGGSIAVSIGEWVDMFLVEPVVDARGNGSASDGIYMEVIRVNKIGSGSSLGGTVRKDKPYLIE